MALKCFVAIAFGERETEEVYDRLILPTLKREGIRPVKVDRIEHNEDINNKTLSLLQDCDFAVADLTFARPSVYWEAGFVERNRPVIYTCRADHLKPKLGSESANLRVHFDLLMKNIVPWLNPSDQVFVRKLRKKLRHVTAPLLERQTADRVDKREADKFASLSLHEKTDRILRICTTQLQAMGYEGCPVGTHSLAKGYYFGESWSMRHHLDNLRRLMSMHPGWVGTRVVNGTLRAVLVHVTDSFSKGATAELEREVLRYPSYNINLASPRKLVEYFFVCSMRSVPRARIMSALKHFRFDQKHDEFLWSTKGILPSGELRRDVEVFPFRNLLGSGSGEEYFLVSAPDRPEAGERVEQLREPGLTQVNVSELAELCGTAILKVRRVRKVSRQIHFRILDGLTSENKFREQFLSSLSED